MKLQDLFTVKRIFDSTPSHINPFMIPEVIFFALLILLGSAILIFARGEIRRFAGKYVAPCLTCGILGLIYVGSRYESLPWLASRFFLLLIVAAFIIWVLTVAIWLFLTLPSYQKVVKKEQVFEKYLPKAKRGN
jgi:hypothetical protein